MRALKVCALLVFCTLVPVLILLLLRLFPDSRPTQTPSYVELITIILAGLTIVLAVLATIVAILAVWGYQSIKNEASAVAKIAMGRAIEDNIANHLATEPAQAAINAAVLRALEAAQYSEAFKGSPADSEIPLAESYPGDEK
jgi:RsiW-degrading membrane proteinase PrsW (M82 family)